MERHTECRQKWLVSFLILLLVVVVQCIIPSNSSAQSSNMTIGNYVKVSETRISRTVYEYTYQASITNSGPGALNNVVATVSINSPHTTIMDNTLTFGDVPAGATVSGTDTFTFRQDRLYSFNWSDLVWNIQCEAPISNTISVGPQGGQLHFPNGVILDIPPGAITQTIPITLTDLPVDAVNAILSARNYASHTKLFLGGFSAEPTGLMFLTPIKAIVPVSPLTSGWVPVQIEVDLNKQTYSIVPGDVVYHGDENVVEMTILHFSGDAAVEIIGSDPTEKECRHCATFNASKCAEFESCPPISDDPCCVPQEPCCTILREERNNSNCYPECRCCREELVKVTVAEADFSAGQCAIVSSTVSVEYPHCKAKCPTTKPIAEESAGCSNIKNFTLSIKTERDWIYSCQQIELRAEVSGTSEDGTLQFYGAAIPVTWDITEGKDIIAEVVKEVGVNGVIIRGKKEGYATIRATADGKPDLYREITLEVRDLSLIIIPEEYVLSVGGQASISANCTDCPNPIEWATDAPAIVDLIPLGGDSVKVVAKSPGTANVWPITIDYCPRHEASTNIATFTVLGHGYNLTWEGTFTKTTQHHCTYYYQNTVMDTTETLTQYWSGSAIIDYNQNVQSLSTSGYATLNSLTASTFIDNGHLCNGSHETDALYTINEAGVERIKKMLHIVEVSWPNAPINAPYIYDPLLFNNGNHADIDAHNVSQESTAGSCTSGYNNSSETDTAIISYWFNPAVLTPDDATMRSFSKNIVEAKNYSQTWDCGGTQPGTYEEISHSVWKVKVVKSP